MTIPALPDYAYHSAPALLGAQASQTRQRGRRWRRLTTAAMGIAQLAVLAVVGMLIVKAATGTHGTLMSSFQSSTSAEGALAGALLRSTTTVSNGGGTISITASPPTTLVIYVFSDTDPEYINNLRFFVKHGMRPGDGCDYIIVIQQEPAPAMMQVLPELPANARYEFHKNECFDWGTIGWVLQQTSVDTSPYTYFVLMNSSVRGPFLPAHWPSQVHWTTIFTERISDTVKLVGPTISCEGAARNGDPVGPWRRNPHVQSYVIATDQVGLSILKHDGEVLKCHNGIHDAIWHAELGSSAAVLNAGYNIDCLMLRYQGVEWQDRSNWGCNGGMNPYLEFMNDGISLDPLEVVFVKVKAHFIDLGWSYARTAIKHDKWLAGSTTNGQLPGSVAKKAAPSKTSIIDNEGVAESQFLKLPKTLHMSTMEHQCFDTGYYMLRNPDIPARFAVDPSPNSAFDHFLNFGQWEARPFRFTCGAMKRVADQREKSSQELHGAAVEAVNAREQAAGAQQLLPAARLFGRAVASVAGAAAETGAVAAAGVAPDPAAPAM